MADSCTLRPSALQQGHSPALVLPPASLAFLAAGQVPPEIMLVNLPNAPLTFPFQLFLGSLNDEPSSIPCAAPWKSGLLFPTSHHLCAVSA
eukprot:10204464-Heterocapsa_arctica.AAC.1